MIELLTPAIKGEELIHRDLSSLKFTAFSGTGFNKNNKWHSGWELYPIGPYSGGGDGLRYAIAIQQLRDLKRYDDATLAQTIIKSWNYYVGTSRDRTTVIGN